MYVNYNAKSLSVQYSYAQKTTNGQKNSQSMNVTAEFSSVSVAVSSGEESKQQAIDNKAKSSYVEDYIRTSLKRILDKVAEHTDKSAKTQADKVYAKVEYFSVTLEVSVSSSESAPKDNLTDENGYFGADKTSQRIVDFALALAGDDTEKLKAAKDGIIKGFEPLKSMFSGELPDLSQKTYDAAMQKMDRYIDHAQSASEKSYA